MKHPIAYKNFSRFSRNFWIVLARELTKLYEEFWRGTIQEAIAYHQNHHPKGEYTVILAGDRHSTQLELSATEINQ
jgi:16S rRNA (cytidine1402-2'-O)-methyltransferase